MGALRMVRRLVYEAIVLICIRIEWPRVMPYREVILPSGAGITE